MKKSPNLARLEDASDRINRLADNSLRPSHLHQTPESFRDNFKQVSAPRLLQMKCLVRSVGQEPKRSAMVDERTLITRLPRIPGQQHWTWTAGPRRQGRSTNSATRAMLSSGSSTDAGLHRDPRSITIYSVSLLKDGE
jgi:hypothetical protein